MWRPQITWQYKASLPMYGGALATASDLVFTGEMDGNFDAFDAKNGKLLWQYNLGIGVCTPPITYRVKGVQYVAVGAGGCHGAEEMNRDAGRPQFGDLLAIFAVTELAAGRANFEESGCLSAKVLEGEGLLRPGAG